MIYTRVMNKGGRGVHSPLESLGTMPAAPAAAGHAARQCISTKSK